jgi:hypothetical protein
VGRYAGHQSEKTLTVSEHEPDCRLTLATAADARAPFREEYELVPIAADACRLTCRLEIGGVPRIAQFLVRQGASKELPRAFDRLKALLASRTPASSAEQTAGQAAAGGPATGPVARPTRG